MARARDPNRDVAKQLYLDSNGTKPLKDIAKELSKDDSLVRKWKRLDKWDDELKGHVSNKTKGHVSNEKVSEKPQQSATTQRKPERKRSGNPNPSHKFTKHNDAAVKHGFYRRVIPTELQDMFDDLDNGISLADMLWDQIKIQYMAIMRAQSIMFVKDKDELVKELKKVRYDVAPNDEGEFEPVVTEEEYEIQFAWDRHASFLNAQSRAISELRSVINQFEAMADKTDERLLKLQQLQLNIDKSNIELETLRKNDGNQVTKVVFVDDIGGDEESDN